MENNLSTWPGITKNYSRSGMLIAALANHAVLGPLSQWPPALQTSLNLILNSPIPMALIWGREYTMFFNDAFFPYAVTETADVLMAEPGEKILPQVWPFMKPSVDLIFDENSPSVNNSHKLERRVNARVTTVRQNFSYSAIHGEGGTVEGVLIVCRDDISTAETDNMRFAGSPLTSEMIEVLNSINEGFFSRDIIRDRYIHLSEGCPKIYGYTTAEFYENPALWYEVIHPEDVVIATREYKLLEKGIPTLTEYRIIHRDKSVRWIEIKVIPVLSEGKLTRVNGIINDITERKNAEIEIVKQKDLFESIINSLPGIFYLSDNEGNLLNWNKNLETVSGYTAKELTNIDPLKLFRAEDKEMLKGKIIQLFKHGMAEVEAHLISKSGEAIPHFFNGRIIEFEEKNALIGMGIDISAHKKVEEEREKVTADLVQRNIDLKQFSYIVSHNLRSPINKIIGLASLFKKFDHVDDPNQKLINHIVNEVANLDNVVKDLTTIVSFQDLGVNVKEEINFRDELNLLIQTLENEIQETKAQITYNFQNPSGMKSIRGYFYSILYNLVSNAIKYRQKSRRLLIHLETFQDDKFVYLWVSDNGSGIDLNKHGKNIFGLYNRFHSEGIPGKGMGLNLVKTQAETLGGKVEVESKPQIGTRFKISFLKD